MQKLWRLTLEETVRPLRALLTLAATCGALGACVAPPYDGYYQDYGAPYRPHTQPAYPPGFNPPRGYSPDARTEYGRREYWQRDLERSDPVRPNDPGYYAPPAYRPDYGQREDDRPVPFTYRSPPAYQPDRSQPEYGQVEPQAPNNGRSDDRQLNLGRPTWC